MSSYTSIINDFFDELPTHVKKILNEYKKLTYLNTFFIHKDYFINHKETKLTDFNNSRWVMKPHLFCAEIYSNIDQYVFPVILTVNNIKSIMEFIPDNLQNRKIITPSINIIKEIAAK